MSTVLCLCFSFYSENGKHNVEYKKETNMQPGEDVLFSGECTVYLKKKSGQYSFI